MLRVASILALVAFAAAQDFNGIGSGTGGSLVSSPSGTQTLFVGDRFRQRCVMVDIPAKDEAIEFDKNGQRLEALQSGGSATFTVESVTVADSGLYTCRVEWQGDVFSGSVNLIVTERPTGSPPATAHQKTFDRFAYQRICKPGCKGQPGDHGPHGEDGAAGPRGPPGPAGPPGTTLRRPIKIQILKGDTGPQGRPGPAGSPGMHGMHGMPGFPGPSGPGGLKGADGQPGYPGQQGPPGPAGTKGELGPRGFPGRDGQPGPAGARGTKGDRGASGPDGVTGENGEPGANGRSGLQGAPGDQGPEGQQGNTGEQGSNGNKGQQGLKGVMGFTGEKGFQGISGLQGEAGEQGATGIKGSTGIVGEKGSIGPEVYIHRRVEKECNQATFGEVAYGPDMNKLYFCNGKDWECVHSGGCKDCDDYVTAWSDWSSCSVTCGDGVESRTRSYRQLPDYALNECDLVETRPCSTGVSCMYCEESGKRFQLGDTTFIVSPRDVAADVLLVVDESSSMETEHAWLPSMVAQLDQRLKGVGIGAGATPNLYSLTGYGAGSTLPDQCPTAKYPPSMSRMFPVNEYTDANKQLSTAKNGDREDGWQALIWAITNSNFRTGPGIGRNIILVTDEDRDPDCDNTLTPERVQKFLQDRGFKVNVVVNMQYAVTKDGQSLGKAIGVLGATAGDRTAILPSSSSTYDSVTGVEFTTSSSAENYNQFTKGQYVLWALGQDGASWDLEFLRQKRSAEFTSAFVDIKTEEIRKGARACSICRCELGTNGLPHSMCIPAADDGECVCRAQNREFRNGVCQ